MKKRVLCAGIVALLCAALIALMWQTESPVEAHPPAEESEGVIRLTPEQIDAARLEIQFPEPKQLEIVHTLPARVMLNGHRYAHITTEASGVARDVRKALGDRVEAGEILAILESRDIAEAKANYLAALRRETLAQGTLAREQQLYQRHVSATADWQSAENDAEQATIARTLAEQKLLAIGLTEEQLAQLPHTRTGDLRLYPLLAPFSGTVVARDLSPGELVPAGHEPYVVADLTTLWVEIGVHGKDMDKIRKGQEIAITNPHTQENATATVIYLSPLVDGETRTARAIAEIDNRDGEWHPGTYVEASVPLDRKEAAVTVPKGAIQRLDGENVVFVQEVEGLKPRPVTLGISDAETIEIVDGLSLNDCCATHNTFVLKSELLKSDEEGE